MIWFGGGRQDRALDAFAEAIRPELEALRVPSPTATLRERILADRAAGARVILPEARELGRPVVRYLLAAVGVIIALLVVPMHRAVRREPSDERLATLFSFFGEVARAEQSPESRPRLPAALPVHPERLRAGTLEYLRVSNDSRNRVTKRAESVFTLAPDSTTGVAAWRIVVTERDPVSGAETKAESLLVRRDDLRLLSRAIHVRPYRRWNGINIQQRVTKDSVNGRMTLDDVKGMRPIARRLPAAFAPYISDAFAPVYFASVPLDARWQGSFTLLGWAVVPNDVLYPVELRVAGAERVQVPAGTFECWKLAIRYSGDSLDYWVRKSDGIAVRAIARSSRSGEQRTVTLIREKGV